MRKRSPVGENRHRPALPRRREPPENSPLREPIVEANVKYSRTCAIRRITVASRCTGLASRPVIGACLRSGTESVPEPREAAEDSIPRHRRLPARSAKSASRPNGPRNALDTGRIRVQAPLPFQGFAFVVITAARRAATSALMETLE
jgi:hypothetical protein